MEIEKLIQREAPGEDVHDNAYSSALMDCYELYKDMPIDTLKDLQSAARETYTGNHVTTAACVVLAELIKEKSTTE
jgi:hypothetical protein